MKNIKIKETYLLVLIVMGLISMAVYSTYALFTASTTINNVVGMTATLTTDNNILEYEMITVGPRETKIIELTVKNSYSSSLYYGAWFQMQDPGDDYLDYVNVGLYTEKNSTPSSGQIAASATKTLLVGISNSTDIEKVVNIGTVGSTTSNLGLIANRKLLPTGWNIPAKVTLNNLGLSLTSDIPAGLDITAPYYTIDYSSYVDGSYLKDNDEFLISESFELIDDARIQLNQPIWVSKSEVVDYQDWYMCKNLSDECPNGQLYTIITGHYEAPQYNLIEMENMIIGEPMGTLLMSSSYTFDETTGLVTLNNPESINTDIHSGDRVVGKYFCMDNSGRCQGGVARVLSTGYSTTVMRNFIDEILVYGVDGYPGVFELSLDMNRYRTVLNNDGIFESEDDFGTSYYFRGDVENNYVFFAGYFWRIVRINGDGTIRMIYDGAGPHENGHSSTDRRVAVSAFKASPYSSNTYIGYMYGAVGSTYENTHTNAYDSTIKNFLDDWYLGVIEESEYAGIIVDAIYCNDRSLVSGTGIGTTVTEYGAYNRLNTNKDPSLKCSQVNDRFTKSAALGNGKLAYPVGLITADEVALAGGLYGTNNLSYYLYTGNVYYTMTPFKFNSSKPYIIAVNESGKITNSSSTGKYGVRPVITISADMNNFLSGNGTMNSPFEVGIEEGE